MIKRFESVSLIKDILSDSYISLWEIDTEDGKEPKLYGNSSYEEIMEEYSLDVRGVVHPDDRARLDKELEEYLKSGKEHTELVYRIKRADRTCFWVKNSITAVEQGGLKKLYCSHCDMTEEVEEQEKLRKTYRERLDRHLRSSGPNVILLGQCNITRDTVSEVINYTSAEFDKDFSSSRTAFITGISSAIIDEDERRSFLGTFLNEPAIRAYRNGFTKLEKICMVKLPTEDIGRYVRFFARLLEDPDTHDIMGNLSVTDMTEQIIRERIMLNLAYVGYDMVSEIDLNRDKQRIMRKWQSGDFIGEERNYYEYLTQFIATYVCEEYREKTAILLDKERLVENLEKCGSFSLNYSIKTESGEIRFKNLTVLATDLRLGKICFARKDITETVEQERKSKAQLEQALAAAEKASLAKGAFLSSMSHDIRTPMNAIIGFAEIIAQNTADKVVVESSVKKILKSGDVLLKLINDILDLSKIESGKATLDFTAVDLNTEIENLSVMFSESTEQEGVNFVVLKNLANRYVLCDNIKLSQIMVNILSNSVKFTRKGGRIVFSINERGKAENGFANYVFSVKDTGIGMSENFRKYAFEMFERKKPQPKQVSAARDSGLRL